MTRKREFVAAERAALADSMAKAGPAGPTLCEGWQTRDLLQHLISREASVARKLRGASLDSDLSATPWPELIEQFREGPPLGSLFWLPGANTAANFEEFFVHHEDVRRAVPGWIGRELPTEVEDAMWRRVRSPFGRIAVRRAEVGIHLHRTDRVGETHEYDGEAASHRDPFMRGEHVMLRAARPGVIVSGPPSELLMFVFGRQQAADVQLYGSADARNRLMHASLGF